MHIPSEIWDLLQTCPEPVTAFVAKLLSDKEQLEQENARLRAQINQNSSNSHIPPSKNIFKKITSLRPKTGRKPGGQPGHKGSTLHRSEKPNVIIEHKANTCKHCHATIPDDAPVIDYKYRQEVEIEIRRVTKEHRRCVVICLNCGKKAKGAFPKSVKHYVQYGPQNSALMLYPRQGNFVPFDRLAKFSRDALHIPASAGTLARFARQAGSNLAQSVKFIREQIIKASVLYCDETGTRVAGKLRWRLTAGTDRFSYLFTHKKRGKEAMDAMGVLPNFTGIAMHDCLKSYFLFLCCLHALCNAHLLRELLGIEENDHQVWPQKMKAVLIAAKKLRDTSAIWPLPRDALETLSRRYDKAIMLGLLENPDQKQNPDAPKKRGRPALSKSRNLINRMKKYKDNILMFLFVRECDFDNNKAERDLRMSKIQQKVSGCFRSEEGCMAFDNYYSYIATARKQKISAYDATLALTSGHPLFTHPPSDSSPE